mmetsp:Transcript_3390/g.6697  ORF Transcript_3390/g.6697 Transcript_3390/m.6697 type:complete len:242 (+) Transcript_3390:11312-12037(+)
MCLAAQFTVRVDRHVLPGERHGEAKPPQLRIEGELGLLLESAVFFAHAERELSLVGFEVVQHVPLGAAHAQQPPARHSSFSLRAEPHRNRQPLGEARAGVQGLQRQEEIAVTVELECCLHAVGLRERAGDQRVGPLKHVRNRIAHVGLLAGEGKEGTFRVPRLRGLGVPAVGWLFLGNHAPLPAVAFVALDKVLLRRLHLLGEDVHLAQAIRRAYEPPMIARSIVVAFVITFGRRERVERP